MSNRYLFATALLLAISCAGALAQPMVLDEGMKLQARIEAHEPGATPCMIWMEPDGPKKGVIVAVHGLGLHKGCYNDFANRMVKFLDRTIGE